MASEMNDIKYWQNRILDSTSLFSNDNDNEIKNEGETNDIMRIIEEAFDEAYQFCPHITLVCDYLDMYSHHYDKDNSTITDDDMRKAFEKAISICGIDIIDGNVIWKRYRDFEIQEHLNNIQDGLSLEELQISKTRVIKVFTRNLSIPLAKNDQCLYEYNQILEDICIDTDESIIQPAILQEKYQKATQLLAPRLIYEERLHQSSFAIMNNNYNNDNKDKTNDGNDDIDIWKKYIQLEISDEMYSRAQRLYERAIMTLNNIEIWILYTEFSVYELKNLQLVLSIACRGLKLHPSHVIFWKFYLISLELTSTDILSINDKVNETVTKALQSGFPQAQDFITILTLKCDYKRRLMSSISEAPKDGNQLVEIVQIVRESFNELETFLETYYPAWESEWIKLVKYRARVEDEGISSIAEALIESNSKLRNAIKCESSKSWEGLVHRFPKSYYSWIEYINWAIKVGEYDLCRKLFRNALKAAVDYSEQLINEWVDFEQQCGTLQQYIDAKAIARAIPKNERNLSIGFVETTTASTSKKRELERDDNLHHKSSVPSKKMKIDDKPVIANPINKAPCQTSSKQHPTTLFVTKFSKNLTDQGLRDMFSGFGTIVAAHVVKDKLTGESKCHGLIQFSNEKEKESARSLHQTVVDDHLISVLPSKFPAMIEEKEKKNIKTEGPVTTKSAISFKPRGVQIKK